MYGAPQVRILSSITCTPPSTSIFRVSEVSAESRGSCVRTVLVQCEANLYLRGKRFAVHAGGKIHVTSNILAIYCSKCLCVSSVATCIV